MNLSNSNIVFILLFLFPLHYASAENIVFWQVLGTLSTHIAVTPVMEELVERGHNVTMITIFPLKDNSSSKIQTIIPKKWADEVGGDWDDNMKFFDMRRHPWNVAKLWYDFLDLEVRGCQVLYEDEEFLQWATSKHLNVDLVILDSVANDCAYGMAHYWKAKIVMYSTSAVNPFMPEAYGLPDESSSVTDVIFGFPSSRNKQMSFWQRFLNGINPVVYYLWRKWVHMPQLEEITRNALSLKSDELPKFVDIEKNTSLVLISTHYSFGIPMSFPPNVIPVGGTVVAKKEKPIPKDMQKFIESAKNGFVYISFGTVAEFARFDEDVKQEFIAALYQFPEMKFIWKMGIEISHTLPDNVFVSKWAPQQTLLGHSKLKAFISHMGMGSTVEAIHHGVPLICLPVLCDQDMNAEIVSERGAGIKLEVLDLKREQLQWAIQEILHNDKYRQGMKRLSHIFKDRPRPPLEDTVWWIEYILRHDNVHEFLSPPSSYQSWWKKRQLDVWFTVEIIIVIIVSLPLVLIALIVKHLFRPQGQGLSKSKKRAKIE